MSTVVKHAEPIQVKKHAEHDQKTHGNWARGGSRSEPTPLQSKLTDIIALDTLNLGGETSESGESLRSEKRKWMDTEAKRRGWDHRPYEAVDQALDESTDSLIWGRTKFEEAVASVRAGNVATDLEKGVVLQKTYTDAVWEAKYGNAATISVSRITVTDSSVDPLESWVVRANEGQVTEWFRDIDQWHAEHDQEVFPRTTLRADIPKADVYLLPWGEGRYRSDYVRIKGEVLVFDDSVKKSIVKHYGPGLHPVTLSPQSVHGGATGGTSSKSKPKLEWRTLNRLKPERNGEIVTDLIAHNDAAQEVTRMEMKAAVVEKLYARLKDNPAFVDFADKAMPMWEDIWNDDWEYDGRAHYENDRTRSFIDHVVNSWAVMDENGIAAVNAGIARKFDIPASRRLDWKQLQDAYGTDQTYPVITEAEGDAAYDALVTAMYDETQASLEHSPDNMIFFRGLKGRNYSGEIAGGLDEWIGTLDAEWGKVTGEYLDGSYPGFVYTDAMLKGRPGASWSASYSTAKAFAQNGVVLAVSVPRSAVLSTAHTGVGALFEDEVVLIDHGQNPVTVLSTAQTNGSFEATERQARILLDGRDADIHSMWDKFPGHDSPLTTISFPASHNDKLEKIAWSNAVLDSFYKRGVWVDLDTPPDQAEPEDIADAIDGFLP